MTPNAVPDSAGVVLNAARTAEAALRRAEAEMLRVALRWALLNPSSDGTASATDAATLTEAGGCEPVAGPGCPGVSEYAVAEFAASLGLSSGPAKVLIGHALELSHRLSRLWNRVLDGDVAVPAARAVAEVTIHAAPPLTMEAADWLDQKIAPLVGQVSPREVDEALAEAVQQFGLAVEADEVQGSARPARHVRVVPSGDPYSGTARVEALLDLADALDLEQALDVTGRDLALFAAGAPESERRAAALGHLARRERALDLSDGAEGDELARTASRRLTLSLHFNAGHDDGGRPVISPTGRLDGAEELILLDQVRGWAAGTHTDVRIAATVDGSVSGAPGCFFPWCDAPLWRCAVVAGVGLLCAVHEALRRDGRWRHEPDDAGVLWWFSPTGDRYRSSRSGAVAPAAECE